MAKCCAFVLAVALVLFMVVSDSAFAARSSMQMSSNSKDNVVDPTMNGNNPSGSHGLADNKNIGFGGVGAGVGGASGLVGPFGGVVGGSSIGGGVGTVFPVGGVVGGGVGGAGGGVGGIVP